MCAKGDARVLIQKGPAVWSCWGGELGAAPVSHWSLLHPAPPERQRHQSSISAAFSFCQTPAESPRYKLPLLPRSQTLTIHSYLLHFLTLFVIFLFFFVPLPLFHLLPISVPGCISSLGFKKGWRTNGCSCNACW